MTTIYEKRALKVLRDPALTDDEKRTRIIKIKNQAKSAEVRYNIGMLLDSLVPDLRDLETQVLRKPDLGDTGT